jgi:hypothetical protein
MFGLIGPKITKKEHLVYESSKIVITNLTNLNDALWNSNWPGILLQYSSMCLVSLCKVLTQSDVWF